MYDTDIQTDTLTSLISVSTRNFRIDRAILTFIDNAYVAGLKEDLGFQGNELVQLQTFYIIGAVTGQIPIMFLLTYIPMHWLIPFLDIAWGIFTLLQFRVTGFAELAAYRFLVGWFEVSRPRYLVMQHVSAADEN